MDSAVPRPADGHTVDLWRRYLLPRRTRALLLGGFLVASTVVQLATPQFLRQFVDGVGGDIAVRVLTGLASLYLASTVVTKVLWVAAEYVGGRLAWSATNELRADLLEHCLRQDMGFFQRLGPGAIIERIDGDVGKLAGYFSKLFLLVVINVLLLAGVGVALFWQDWRVGLVYLPFIVGGVFLLRRIVGKAVSASAEQREAESKQAGYMEERLAGLEDLQGVGAGRHALNGFWKHAAELTRLSKLAAKAGVRWPSTAERLATTGYVTGIAMGAWLYLTDRITLGTVFALVAYLAMIRMPLFVITMQFKDMEDALAAQRRVRELLAIRSRVRDGTRDWSGRAPEVGMSEVGFFYDTDRAALDGVSLNLPAGRSLGVVGRTGSGKSTLVRLMFRFADPDRGAITFDGTDIRQFTVESLRRGIALVTQEVQLFRGTVRDNVTFFDSTVEDARVREALDEVGLDDWLTGLPDGLDTLLGDGSHGLSAGQGQLLAFARVLVADPGLVLLDEATSRLDPATEAALETATRRLLRGRTAIVVAHKLNTLRAVDQVLVLDEGRPVEYGERAALSHVLETPEVLT